MVLTIISKYIKLIVWLIKELIKVASGKRSFFSKKRIFEIVAFTSGELTLLCFFFYNISKLTTIESISIATVFFAVAGYTLSKTEAAKKNYTENE
jgi:hypothetical protein